VPAATYCGTCGAHLSPHRGDGRGRARLDAYAAAPGEHTLRLAVASSLFPHLSNRSLTPFRLGLAALFVALVSFAMLSWQAPLITVGALGLPLMFLLYLHESDVDDDISRRSLFLTAAIGVVLGAGWASVTGAIVAESYDVALEPDAISLPSVLDNLVTLSIPVGAAVLMLVPAVVMRLSRPQTRESLDGFVIGALGAISFTAAAILTRLAPQFETGVSAADRPAADLLVQAGIQGVALPLTAAAVGGLVGTALWFGRPKFIVASVIVALGLFAAVGMMDVIPLFRGLHFGGHMVITLCALLALRVGLQVALLREEHDPANPSGQVLCPHCDHVVPDMPFCPNCGVAARAASRTSRTARRNDPGDPADPATEPRPGYAMPADSYAAVPLSDTSSARLLSSVGIGAAIAAVAGVAVAVFATPTPPRFVCPPDCGGPPFAESIESNPRFVSEDGEFSVQYPGPGTAYEATLNPDGVDLQFVGGDTGTMQLFGMPAGDRTAKQIADELIGETYPDATTEYEIPNAMVGYQPGYGAVVDEYPQDASGTFTRLRLVVMVSVKQDYALIAAAIGPYREFTRDFGNGHPSGANLQLAMDMGKYVNSFRWLDPTG
jgi:hypothetical protein